MEGIEWLKKFIMLRTGSMKPDGRPLYAYKCTDVDYDELKFIVQRLFIQFNYLHLPLSFEPLFCLFAAETWRRSHIGGSWAWETVFEPVCDYIPTHSQRSTWVRKGLRFWGRSIIKSDAGHNEYLVTIACEGGLPLLLLQNENASLYRYFKNLLKSYHQERQSPFCDAVAIARRLSGYLPRSLQQEIVFNLGGDLVQKIVELQEKIPNAVDPIQALDLEYPKWRDTLPLPLEEETVELLLKNLVHELQEIIITERQRVRWRRRLVWISGQATIEQQLELPTSFKGVSLKRWSNRLELPERMRLMIRSATR